MTEIISFERFKSQYKLIKTKVQELKLKFPEDLRLKKISRTLYRMKSAYSRDKSYAIKYLNTLEKYRLFFSEERGALIVKAIELMEKVILHKKINTDLKFKNNTEKSQDSSINPDKQIKITEHNPDIENLINMGLLEDITINKN